MSQDIKTVISEILKLRFLPESERTEYFDSVLAPSIKKIMPRIEDFFNHHPDPETLKKWLYIQSATLGWSVEGITEVTYELRKRFPQEIQAALEILPPEQQARIESLFREFQGEENIDPEVVRNEEAATAARLGRLTKRLHNTPRSATSIFGDFVGTHTELTSRGFPIVQGILTLYDRDGGQIDTYAVNTGGGARTYRMQNGPLPPGVYRLSNHRPRRDYAGMVLHGVGFSFDLYPAEGTPVFGRSLFRVHPDEDPIGTYGCLGIREPAKNLRECEANIVAIMKANGDFKVSVKY